MRISDWSSDVCSSDLMAELISQIAPFSAAWRPFVMPSQMPDRNDPMRPTAAPTISGKTANIARTNATARPRPEVKIGRAHVELQSLMRISYAVFCLKKKNNKTTQYIKQTTYKHKRTHVQKHYSNYSKTEH